MTEMVLRSKMKRTGQTAAAETDLRADTDVKVSLISKIAYGMGMWAVTSAGCLWEIS